LLKIESDQATKQIPIQPKSVSEAARFRILGKNAEILWIRNQIT